MGIDTERINRYTLCILKQKEFTHEQTLIHSRCFRSRVRGRHRFGLGGHAAWPSAASSPSAFDRMSVLPRHWPCASQLAWLHEALPRMQRFRAQAAAPSASEAYAPSASEAYAEAYAEANAEACAEACAEANAEACAEACAFSALTWWASWRPRWKARCAWSSLMSAGGTAIRHLVFAAAFPQAASLCFPGSDKCNKVLGC